MWRCPTCGQTFVAFVAAAEENGPVTVSDDEVRDWLAEAYLRRSRAPAARPAPDR